MPMCWYDSEISSAGINHNVLNKSLCDWSFTCNIFILVYLFYAVFKNISNVLVEFLTKMNLNRDNVNVWQILLVVLHNHSKMYAGERWIISDTSDFPFVVHLMPTDGEGRGGPDPLQVLQGEPGQELLPATWCLQTKIWAAGLYECVTSCLSTIC